MADMETIKISQLPVAGSITKDSILPIVQNEETQSATVGQIVELAETIPGPQGPEGPQGEPGKDGTDATVDIVQETGTSQTAVMSQNAVSNAVNAEAEARKQAVQALVDQIQQDLTDYYTKSQVDGMISAIPKFAIQVVSELPTEDISATTVYLVASGTDQSNLYTEYINVDGKWEKLGEQTVDLTGYYTKEEVDAKFPVDTGGIADGAVTTQKLADGAVTTDKLAEDTIKDVAGQSMLGEGDAFPTFYNDDIVVEDDVARITAPNFVYGLGSMFAMVSNKLNGASKISINGGPAIDVRYNMFNNTGAQHNLTFGTGWYNLVIIGINNEYCAEISNARPQITGDEIADGTITSDNVDYRTFPSVTSHKDTGNKASVTLTVKLPRPVSSGYYLRTDVVGNYSEVVENLLFFDIQDLSKVYITPTTSTTIKLDSVTATNYNSANSTIDLTFNYSGVVYWYLRIEAMNRL